MVFRARPNGSPLTPGPVSLGRGSNQACSGDDPRLTDARESIYVDGVIVGKRRNVNLVAGTNVTLTGTDVPDTDTVDVTIDASGGGSGNVDWYDNGILVGSRPAVDIATGGAVEISTSDNPGLNRVDIIIKVDQPSLTGLAPLTPAADQLAYYTSSTTAATTDLTSFARTLLDDADAAASRTTLGLAAIASTASASDLSSGTVATARLGSGTANSTTYLRGDQTWASIPGATGAQSVTTINFGAFPGSSDASLVITGQTGIDTSSVVNAWLMPTDTDDHTADEHRVETISVMAGSVIPGVGFTIYAQNTSQRNEPLIQAGNNQNRNALTITLGDSQPSIGGIGTRIYGKWTVAWKWS